MRASLSIIAVVALGLIGACDAKQASSGGGAAAPSPAAGALPANATAERVADAFYAAYQSLPSGGGVPDEDGRGALAPYITTALSRLLSDADDAETDYAKATNGESPPLIEGDPFSSLFEGATAVDVTSCQGDDKARQCAVDLVYRDQSGKETKWQDTADVVMTDKGWRVDDIEYGGTWDFGNKGRLTELLKSAIEESRKPVE